MLNKLNRFDFDHITIFDIVEVFYKNQEPNPAFTLYIDSDSIGRDALFQLLIGQAE